ncbi:hypothetical protein [Megamonas funiformis]|uniref:hypothetical protein n=1 Tax=Megamonas funiformis TaxID=437897 RepID=UPI003F81C9AE
MTQYLDLDGLKTLVTNINNKFIKKGEVDNTFVEVVTELPKTNIKKHIYLVPEAAASGVNQNKYAEYVYTGTLPIAVDGTTHNSNYDASKWEKLGDFQAEIDLINYAKKTNVIGSITLNTTSSDVNFDFLDADRGSAGGVTIEAATTTKAGAMSAADKAILTKLANRYPFDISWINAKPDVAELDTDNVINLSWNFSNEDFHRVTSQKVAGTGAYTGSATPAVGTKTQSFSIPKANVTPGTDRKVVTFTLTAIADSTTKTKTCTITFVHASYCGVVDANKASLTAAEIIKLGNKAVINSKNRTVSITQSNQKLVYAYPAYFGNLTSIKDGNGFQGFSGYSKLTAVTVNGTNYNVYMQKTPATATGSYTFA